MKRDDNNSTQNMSSGGRATSRRQTRTSIQSEVVSRSSWKILILFGIFFIFLNVNFVSATCTNNTYSGSGDWIINSTNSPNVCSDMEITLNGNLYVQSGGNLTFDNVTLLMNCSTDREYEIKQSGGSFYIYDSNFSALNQNYQIIIGNGIFWVDNSTFRGDSDDAGIQFMQLSGNVPVNFSMTNSHIGYGNVYYALHIRSTLGSIQHGFIENNTFDGANYDVRYYSSGPGYLLQMKNCNWDGKFWILDADLACLDCNFPWSAVQWSGTSSIYSKNHNDLTNQTLVGGSFNYTNSLYDEFKTEANRTIQLMAPDTTIEIPSNVNVTFDNVTMVAGQEFSNSNSLTINGHLIINRTNFTLLDIALTNPGNIITNGVYFFHKLYLDIQAILDDVEQSNVNVTGYNALGEVMFTDITNSTGHISRQNITLLFVNDSGLTNYNPYTINTSQYTDSNNYSRTLNFTVSSSITIPQDLCEYPSSGDWTINDGNKICSNQIITLQGDVNITNGYSLTLYNSTLNLTSTSSSNSYIYVENNASFYLNKSKLIGKVSNSYDVYVVGSPTSNITYIDSQIDRYTNNTLYVGYGTITIQNSTFLKQPDVVVSRIDTDNCKITFITNDTISKALVINKSVFYGSICFQSEVSGGQINLSFLDSDWYDFGFYTNANTSQVTINNTLDLKVLDDDLNPVSSTVVNITDENGNSVYNGITDSNGEINSISLTHRIINKTSDITKNYALSSNGKTFNLTMGMPRKDSTGRQIIIGTYDADYEEKLSRVPYLYDFGFTIHDDTDTFDYRNGNATYQGFYNAGFLTSVSAWAETSWDKTGFVDNANQRNWLLDLQSKGFELALHSATGGTDTRQTTINAFNNWSEYFGFPMMYIEHSSNGEHLISGSGADATSNYYLLDLVNTSNVSYYWNLDAYENNALWKTSAENSSSFYNGWKAYGESIDPITGERWSNGEISLFPNYTNEKAKLPLVDEHGTSINLTSMIGKIHIRDAAHIPSTGLRQLYTPAHIFDLVETKDLTIMYTHSGSYSEFNSTLAEVARYDGYFVPAGVLLNYSSKLERVSITPGDKTFTVTNNGEYEIEGVVVYPDTNGTIINISYANISDGRYLLSIGLDQDEMMLPPLSPGESVTVTYDIIGAYDSNIPKITEITNSNVELRNAIYNSTAKKTEFKIGLDRITTYNTTNSTPRWTNMTIENLDSSKTYEILRDDSAWTNYSWKSDNTTLYIWTFLSEHNFIIQEKQDDGASCTYADSCLGGYCVHNICRSSSTYCGDGYCDSGETCSSCSTDCGVCPTTSSGGYPTYYPTQEQMQNGFSKLLRKNQKVQMSINEQTHTAVIKSVNNTDKKVEIELEEINKTFELNENETQKIDLDNDRYYDLQISVKGFGALGYAELEFKEIHEEVPASEQEGQESPSKTEFEIKNWMWVVGGLMGLIVVGLVIRRLFSAKP